MSERRELPQPSESIQTLGSFRRNLIRCTPILIPINLGVAFLYARDPYWFPSLLTNIIESSPIGK